MVDDTIASLNAALEGRYRIERELGEGGMAIVYLADDVRHDRRVAIKVLRPGLAVTLGPQRFLQEIRITAGIQHPHVLPLHDSGEAGGFVYYVMPHVDGESLKDRLAREGALPVDEACAILKDVCEALAAAHASGVVHRDIKPANILLQGRDALVADFGVAKAVRDARDEQVMTTVGTSLGTPAYMSPEQAAGDEVVDHRSDIYSLGALGYELLTGRAPFGHSGSQSLLVAHITRTPEPLSKHRPAVPEALEGAILRCLEKQRADRWQSVSDLLPFLEAGAASISRPAGATHRDTPGPRRTSWYKWALPIAAVGGIAAWAWLSPRSAPQPAPDEGVRIALETPVNGSGEPTLDYLAEQLAVQMQQSIAQHAAGVSIGDPGSDPAGGRATHRFRTRYTSSPAGLTLSFEVSDALSNESLRRFDPVRAPTDSIDSVVRQTGDAAAVAAMALYTGDLYALRFKSLPRRPTAFRLFLNGLSAFQEGRNADAAGWAERAIEAEPGWPAPYQFLRVALSNSGRSTEWASYEPVYQALIPRMTEEERLFDVVQWGPNLQDRVDAAAENFRLTDGAGQTGYLLAFLAIRTNQLAQARRGIDGQPREGVLTWPFFYWLDHQLLHLSGDFVVELNRARREKERFLQSGDALGYIRFFRDEARALAALDSVSSAERVYGSIKDVPFESELKWLMLFDIAMELRAHGHGEAADRAFGDLLDWSQTQELSVESRAETAYYAGAFEQAVPLLRDWHERAEGAERVPPTAMLSLALEQLGRTSDAARYEAELPRTATDLAGIEGPRAETWDASGRRVRGWQWLAALRASRGEAADAVQWLRESFELDVPYYAPLNPLFLHNRPEFDPIRDDAVFARWMEPRR